MPHGVYPLSVRLLHYTRKPLFCQAFFASSRRKNSTLLTIHKCLIISTALGGQPCTYSAKFCVHLPIPKAFVSPLSFPLNPCPIHIFRELLPPVRCSANINEAKHTEHAESSSILLLRYLSDNPSLDTNTMRK